MPVLAGEIVAEAQVLLNDTGQAIYTNAKVLPLLKKVYRKLELQLTSNGMLETKEVSATLTVPVNTDVLNTVTAFPSDFIEPRALGQRDVGSTSAFVPIDHNQNEPFVQNPTGIIQSWTFREGEIKIGRSSAIREVRLVYTKSLSPINDVNSNIPLPQAFDYLASATAAMCALVIGENANRANILQGDAEMAKTLLMSIFTKSKQNTPARRKRYRPFGRI